MTGGVGSACTCSTLASSARWLSIAPFGRPLVPEVYISSASASGSTSGSCGTPENDPKATSPGAGAPTTTRRSGALGCGSASSRAAAADERSNSTARAPLSATSQASSAVVDPVLAGTATRPARSAPKYAATNSGELDSASATRSPGSSPSACRPAAAVSTPASTCVPRERAPRGQQRDVVATLARRRPHQIGQVGAHRRSVPYALAS